MLPGWMQRGSIMMKQGYWILCFVSVVLWSAMPTAGAPPRSSQSGTLKLIKVEPMGQEVQLVFRVPELLDLICPMQLRIGDFSLSFRELQDRNARTARFVMSRDLLEMQSEAKSSRNEVGQYFAMIQ